MNRIIKKLSLISFLSKLLRSLKVQRWLWKNRKPWHKFGWEMKKNADIYYLLSELITLKWGKSHVLTCRWDVICVVVGDLCVKKEAMELLLELLACRLLKHTFSRVRWNGSRVSTILWKSFTDNDSNWGTASLFPKIEKGEYE